MRRRAFAISNSLEQQIEENARRQREDQDRRRVEREKAEQKADEDARRRRQQEARRRAKTPRKAPVVDVKKKTGGGVRKKQIEEIKKSKPEKPKGRIGRPQKADATAVKAELERRRTAGKKTSVTALAKHFGVSVDTISRRLKNK
jgi:hypothetical protein